MRVFIGVDPHKLSATIEVSTRMSEGSCGAVSH
jgi:hypothetical protein